MNNNTLLLLLAFVASLASSFILPKTTPNRFSSPLPLLAEAAGKDRELKVITNPLNDVRQEDGKVHVPIIPFLGLAMAGVIGTSIKMRENNAKMEEKRMEEDNKYVERLKARTERGGGKVPDLEEF